MHGVIRVRFVGNPEKSKAITTYALKMSALSTISNDKKFKLTCQAVNKSKTIQRGDGWIVMSRPKKKKAVTPTPLLELPSQETPPSQPQESSNDWRDHLSRMSLTESTKGTLVSSNINGLDLHEGLHILVSASVPNIEMIRIYTSTYPWAVTKRDARGNLPLHIAIDRDDPAPLVVCELLRKYPASAQIKDHCGNLPLFLACRRPKTNCSVLKALLLSFSMAASTTLFGSLALHHLCHKGSGSPDAIQALLSFNEHAAKTPNTFGNLPLHYLCAAKNPNLESLRILLAAYPPAITYLNKSGETPIGRALAIAEIAENDDDDNNGLLKTNDGVRLLDIDGSGLFNINDRVRFLLTVASHYSALNSSQWTQLRQLNWNDRKNFLMSVVHSTPLAVAHRRNFQIESNAFQYIFSVFPEIFRLIVSYV